MTFVMNSTLIHQKLQASINRFHMQIRILCFPCLTSFAIDILHICKILCSLCICTSATK